MTDLYNREPQDSGVRGGNAPEPEDNTPTTFAEDAPLRIVTMLLFLVAFSLPIFLAVSAGVIGAGVPLSSWPMQLGWHIGTILGSLIGSLLAVSILVIFGKMIRTDRGLLGYLGSGVLLLMVLYAISLGIQFMGVRLYTILPSSSYPAMVPAVWFTVFTWAAHTLYRRRYPLKNYVYEQTVAASVCMKGTFVTWLALTIGICTGHAFSEAGYNPVMGGAGVLILVGLVYVVTNHFQRRWKSRQA